MASALTSFERAENACLLFLGKSLGIEIRDDGDLSIDDYIPGDLVGKSVFSMSGGPEQNQLFGARAPGCCWYAYGNFLGQYETRDAAVDALGMLQNAFPARRSDSGPGVTPNVRNFELLEHPEIASVIVTENNAVIGRVWTMRARFRVVYDNTQD